MSDYAVTGQDEPVEPTRVSDRSNGFTFAIQIHVTDRPASGPEKQPGGYALLNIAAGAGAPPHTVYRITNLVTRVKKNVIARERRTLLLVDRCFVKPFINLLG